MDVGVLGRTKGFRVTTRKIVLLIEVQRNERSTSCFIFGQKVRSSSTRCHELASSFILFAVFRATSGGRTSKEWNGNARAVYSHLTKMIPKFTFSVLLLLLNSYINILYTILFNNSSNNEHIVWTTYFILKLKSVVNFTFCNIVYCYLPVL